MVVPDTFGHFGKKVLKIYWKCLNVVLENNCLDHTKNEEVLRKAEEERNILHKIKRRKAI